MQVEPVTLVGKIVRLEPLTEAHLSGLAKVGLDPGIWEFMRYGRVDTEAQLGNWVRELLELQARGTDLPFTVIHQDTGNLIGCTRYLDIDLVNRALEIGGTWYGVEYQGTLVNSECKYLLLKHAFEELDCIRVWFKTDLRNKRSQHALESLGAVKEGVLRHHMLLPDGYIRDSVVYSILPEEWARIKLKLEAKLGVS
ncbi:MAG TPA: GNAT family protein [Anaerolineales bacterium]